MKKLSIIALSVLMLAGCTTMTDDEPKTGDMVAPAQEEVCALRDDNDKCICKKTNAAGQCEQGGGTVIIQGGGTNPGGSADDVPDE